MSAAVFPPATDKSTYSESQDSSSGTSEQLSENGWEDVEPDDEEHVIIGLFSTKTYPNIHSMLQDTKDMYDFDLVKTQKELGLDFLDTIKLVNYIRSEVKRGNTKFDISSKSIFDDEKFLKPVLEDDALLYSLDDLNESSTKPQSADTVEYTSESTHIRELQEALDRLQSQFTAYRLAVQDSLDEQLQKEDNLVGVSENNSCQKGNSATGRIEAADSDYFTSYSYNTIHETMLKDTIRTDAYRDFIYDNKALFKDKVVLDVGCGTGILSMFCAKAGAKMVIAVDNSNIIEKARENVYENGLGDVIRCLRGKIEEVTLPAPQVDIIVSEWMGYGLLFEAMLDSVLWARDHYLVKDGLMVPSHTTLRIAPFVDADFVDSHIAFWNEVYGFKMTSMLEKIHDEVVVRTTTPSTAPATSAIFLELPLHTITIPELTFVRDFQITLAEDIDRLDGWNIWFDIFFMPSADSNIPSNAVPSHLKKKGVVAFTTGPDGPETHWQQCVLLIKHSREGDQSMKSGHTIHGKIGYSKKEEGSRSLEICVQWNYGNQGASQSWSLQ